MRWFISIGLALVLGVTTALSWSGSSARSLLRAAATAPTIDKQSFGKTVDGVAVDIYTLSNANGAKVQVITYGARVVSIDVPDRDGKLGDVALGYDDLAGYEKDSAYIGAIVGRYGNRIAKGRFTLDGATYTLAQNNNGNHLHGGLRGFDKVVWQAKSAVVAEGARLTLSYLSKDKEEGYPGNLSVTVVYTWTSQNELKIHYTAHTDKATILNLTNHAYFNLAGAGNGDILNHELKINASRFTPTDTTAIPLGELRPVKGTPLDFTTATPIGARIEDKYEQIVSGAGYDHNFVLNKPAGSLGLAAEAYEPGSGRVLRVNTTEPGMQFYSGNFLNGATGKQGRTYPRRSGFCLETQHFPDSPNEPKFPTTVLRPGREYSQTTIFQFTVRK
jgi:aldose 1-epimerase